MSIQKALIATKKIIPTPIFKFFQPHYHFVMSFIAALWYGFPSQKLIVIGITGTTGKTTATFLMKEIFKSCGFKVGYTSTAMFGNGNKEWLNDKKMTMLGRFTTQKLLRDMVKNGCQYAIVETTSEGVIQSRHRFINYDILVFTGLYPEHIESHGGFENYKQAKGLLFAHLQKCKQKYTNALKQIKTSSMVTKNEGYERVKKTIIVNGDDEYADYFLRFWAEKKYSIKSKASKINTKEDKLIENKIEDIYIKDIKAEKGSTSFTLDPIYEYNLGILGDFNIINTSFGLVAAHSQNLKMAKIKKALSKIKGIPGRLERLSLGQDFEIIVDYAFEPLALTKLFEIVNSSLKVSKIIHVVGSTGGGRDVARRPELGKISAKNADITIVTNEDPYDEDPEVIIRDVAAGAKKAGAKLGQDLFINEDRQGAIAKALEVAKKGDLVLVTGKGCEQAICINDGKTIPWDDRKVIQAEYFRNNP